jgi:hypothetical protein
MPRIPLIRLLASGLLAGLIMNISEAALHAGILGADTESLYRQLNAPPPNPSSSIPILVGTTFLMGIVSMWLYAALLPQLGSRFRTAAVTGIVVWILSHVWSGVYLGAGYAGIITPKLAWTPVVWGLLETTVSIFAGAGLCKERPRVAR